jgi:5-methylcytosine-specific restriction endonuclease McrA
MSSRVESRSGTVEATPRKRLTLAEKHLLDYRQEGLCGCGCGEPLWGALIDEHILPLELGGSNDLSNRALYLVDCAKKKTREDVRRIRKAARLRRDASPETRRKSPRPLRSRGFRRADELK